jgi:hypothetical protein
MTAFYSVSSLSGVVLRATYPIVVFSFIVNQSTRFAADVQSLRARSCVCDRSSAQRNADIDAMAELLAQLT